MKRSLSVTVGAIALIAALGSSAAAEPGSVSDPQGDSGGYKTDIRTVYHSDTSSTVVAHVQFHSDLKNDAPGWTCDWVYDFDENGERDATAQSSMEYGPSLWLYDANGGEVGTENQHGSVTWAAASNGDGSTSNNTLRISVNRSGLTAAGMGQGDGSYRYYVECGDVTGETDGGDRTTDGSFGTTHTLGGSATPSAKPPTTTTAPPATAAPATQAPATSAPETAPPAPGSPEPDGGVGTTGGGEATPTAIPAAESGSSVPIFPIAVVLFVGGISAAVFFIRRSGWLNRFSRRTVIAMVAGATALLLIAVGFGAYTLFGGSEPPPVTIDDLFSPTPLPTEGVETDAPTEPDPEPKPQVDATQAFQGSWAVDNSLGSFDYDASDFTSAWAGYRVDEEFDHGSGKTANTAVGRTPDIAGTMTISGNEITAASFNVNMQTLVSDDQRRDDTLRERGLETDRFPESSFTLTQPVRIDSVPGEGDTVKANARGSFNLHGVTREITVPLEARWRGNEIVVVSSFDVRLADYDIERPTVGFVVSISEVGAVEMQLRLKRR